ncbi:hypothetical protein HK102_002069, partial [Quaeritorhiza haematococci]
MESPDTVVDLNSTSPPVSPSRAPSTVCNQDHDDFQGLKWTLKNSSPKSKAPSKDGSECFCQIDEDSDGTTRQEEERYVHIPDAIEEEELGPTVRLHRFDVSTTILKIIILLWLISGPAILLTIGVCVTVNVTYNSFSQSGSSLDAVPLMIALTFHAVLIWTNLKSFMRTFARVALRVWNWELGANAERDVLPAWVVERTEKVVRAVKGGMVSRKPKSGTAERNVSTDNEGGGNSSSRMWNKIDVDPRSIDNANRYILTFLLLVVVGVPLLTISSLYGFFAISSVITAAMTLLSAAFLIITNGIAKIVRAYKVISTMARGSSDAVHGDAFIRGVYFATTGKLAVVEGVVAIYDRHAGASAALVDLTFKDPNRPLSQPDFADQPGKAISFMCLAGFFVLSVITRDIFMILPCTWPSSTPKPTTTDNATSRTKSTSLYRTGGLIFSIVSQWFLAIAGRVQHPGYTFTVALFVAFSNLNYRHPRLWWSGYYTRIAQMRNPLSRRFQTRATKNARSIIYLISTLVTASLIIGLLVSATKFIPWTLQPRDVTPQQLNPSFIPAYCTLDVPKSQDLTVMDFALLSLASYAETPEQAAGYLNRSARLRSDFVYKGGNIGTGESEFGQYGVFYSRSRNMSVVAVRGTYSVDDLLQDLYQWSTPVLVSASSSIGTFISRWPVEAIAFMVWLIVQMENRPNRAYYLKVEEEVVKPLLFTGSDNDTVIMTGHSLGGAVAGIVATRMGVPVIGFSAPGLAYSSLTYDVGLNSLMKTMINIVPWHDPVPRFDYQMGFIQDIPCDGADPAKCHSLEHTMETLRRECA